MNILIISPWYPNHVHPQDGNFVRVQATALAASFSVEVVSVVAEEARKQVQVDTEGGNVRVIRSTYAADGSRFQRVLRRRAAWKAALARRELRPDLIHAHVLIDGGIIASQLAKELNIPFVVTEHSHRYLLPWPAARKPELWLARRAAQRAAYLLPVSPSLRLGMESHGIRGRYQIVPNLIQTDYFYPTETVKDGPFTFLHVSDFSANKNIGDLLTAFSRLSATTSDVKLHIAGNGDMKKLETLLKTLHLRPRQISLSGPHEPQEIGNLMRNADAFVLCSTLETQSVVIIEAMLSGLPCIAADSGGPRDIMTLTNDGQLYPPRNIEALQQAMGKLVFKGSASFTERQKRSNIAKEKYGSTLSQITSIYHHLKATDR